MSRITDLFKIRYPIIQGGMVWCSGWRLASAVSEYGGLGLLGAGSMDAELLREHIRKCRAATSQPFGVNVSLQSPDVESLMGVIIDEGIEIVFTSAGNPKLWTRKLRDHDITVAHVVSSGRFASKAEEAGVNAIVAEGVEAGGHNGREETTTLTLIPQVRKYTRLPLIAAGGIGTGAGMLAAQCLGADGVQIGTRFALSQESSAHEQFKKICIAAADGDTRLQLRKLVPTRLLKNAFSDRVKELEDRGAEVEELRELMGRGRARLGIFEGDVSEGMLEIGQVSACLEAIEPVSAIIAGLLEEYWIAKDRLLQTWR
jgi:enoyl-[acyl-carrier protein] reductase II